MGAYTDLVSDAIIKFVRENAFDDAVSTRDLARRYNPEMTPQGMGQVLKYQQKEINAVLKKARVRVTGYVFNPRRKRHMVQISRL